MRQNISIFRIFVITSCLLLGFTVGNSLAGLHPVDPYNTAALTSPDPAVTTFDGSIAYYNNQLIYSVGEYGEGKKIYAYNLQTSNSTLVVDLSADSNFVNCYGVSGFLVGCDNHLYFLDNGVTDKIYRIDLTAAWPTAIESLATGVVPPLNNLFAITQNPWTGAIWFASSEYSPGKMYLYEVDADFTVATQRASFAQPNNGASGPIIFKDATTLLYGEFDYINGFGYFHLMDSTTGDVTTPNYLTFAGGLAGAVYGYDNVIYASSGSGSTIYEIQGAENTPVATTDDDAQGIVFDGASYYISEQIPYSLDPSSGAVSFHRLWDPTATARIPTDQVVDDSVDLNADGVPDNQQANVILSVNAADGSGSKQIGISAVGGDVFVEEFKAVAADTIDDDVGRPSDLPFGMINYQLNVTSADGTAEVTVYLSEAAAAGDRWYKYDSTNGWVDYSDHATFSADRKSATIELKDGGYGDADGKVDGKIIDPIGIGTPEADTSSDDGGGGGSGCFIQTTF